MYQDPSNLRCLLIAIQVLLGEESSCSKLYAAVPHLSSVCGILVRRSTPFVSRIILKCDIGRLVRQGALYDTGDLLAEQEIKLIFSIIPHHEHASELYIS